MNNSDKIILDLCGGTGAWGDPYRRAGYVVDNMTLPRVDILEIEKMFLYIRNIEREHDAKVYGILAAPPCTEFSKAAWNKKRVDRNFKNGMNTVKACLKIIWEIQIAGAPLKFWALENPMGYLYNFLGKPAFYFQPWQFGEQGFLATKRTAIWGYFKEPKRTIYKRNIPFISPHTSKRDELKEITIPIFEKFQRKKENKEWYSANTSERAITPPGFAQAFFETNQ